MSGGWRTEIEEAESGDKGNKRGRGEWKQGKGGAGEKDEEAAGEA